MANEHYQKCIAACLRCVESCSQCCGSASDESKALRAACMRFDCAQICRLAIELMNRDSEFVEEVCGVCAAICEACSQEHARDANEHCQQCAELCRRCASECRAIAFARLSPIEIQQR